MSKAEPLQVVANAAGVTNQNAGAVNAVLEASGSTIAAGDKVILPGFGTFEGRQRPARQGRNPSTGEAVMIAAKKAPAFKPGKALKDKVNG